MSPKKLLGPRLLGALAAALALAIAVPLVATAANAAPAGFVQRSGAGFVLDGQPFRFGGTNNYYLHYKSDLMVNDVFADAQAMGIKVIRAWTFLECGGTKPNSDGGCSAGANFWMQRMGAGGVEYNQGVSGLQALDRMIAAAAAHNVKLLLPFTGNWRDFGGMDQYVTWFDGQFHDQFYTDARIRQAYKNWISTLLNRTNTVTGVRYKDDPTIFSWELANEPRCINASLPTSGTCTADTLTAWADEMSSYAKSIDANHMLSVGDEGFFNGGGCGSNAWPCTVTDGVDNRRLTALTNVDFGTYHLYPAGWGISNALGTAYINQHNAIGTELNKPMILEEFGIPDQGSRAAVYTDWANAVRTGGGDGWMFWILTGIQDDGQLYPDFDGFRVAVPSADATLLANLATQMNSGGSTDVSPPTAPGTPVASAVTTTGATLAWTASTDNVGVTGYDIVNAANTVLASSTTTSATLTGLTAATQYTLRVIAKDAAGNRSTASAAVTFTTAAGTGAGACKIAYSTNDWQGGFTASIAITNTGAAGLNGWTLRFAFPGTQKVTNGWSATWTQTGADVTAASMSWNGTLAPGAATTVGFNGSWAGSNAKPTSFTLNGNACALG